MYKPATHVPPTRRTEHRCHPRSVIIADSAVAWRRGGGAEGRGGGSASTPRPGSAAQKQQPGQASPAQAKAADYSLPSFFASQDRTECATTGRTYIPCYKVSKGKVR